MIIPRTVLTRAVWARALGSAMWSVTGAWGAQGRAGGSRQPPASMSCSHRAQLLTWDFLVDAADAVVAGGGGSAPSSHAGDLFIGFDDAFDVMRIKDPRVMRPQ